MSIGLEVELLAPPGATRDDLARALAKDTGRRLHFGLKYHGAGSLPDGRPDCRLTSASRVPGFATFVDDPTIRDDLGADARTRRIARTDDVRLAAWLERSCWHPRKDRVFDALLEQFEALETDDGYVDPWGLPLLQWHAESVERARVCEVVLRPMSARERGPMLRRVLRLARSLGFVAPAEAAVHVHFDAAPFRTTRLLRRLVLAWSDEWKARFSPNPRCRKLGPFPTNVVRVARQAADDDDFETVAAAYLLAGLHRETDVNLLGLVERFPKQPTIEFRCLPGSIDAEAILDGVALAGRFIEKL